MKMEIFLTSTGALYRACALPPDMIACFDVNEGNYLCNFIQAWVPVLNDYVDVTDQVKNLKSLYEEILMSADDSYNNMYTRREQQMTPENRTDN